MSNHLPSLGDRVRCKISGFTGIATTHATHLAGCDRLWVLPAVGEDGKAVDGQWLDIDMLEIVDPAVVDVMKYTRRAPGGIELPNSR